MIENVAYTVNPDIFVALKRVIRNSRHLSSAFTMKL
jgi:hypothetical protein